MKIKCLVFAFSLFFSSAAFAVEWTPPGGKVSVIQTSESGTTYARTEGNNVGWGMPSCPAAVFATFYPTDSNGDTKGPERIFAQLLAARYNGDNVRLRGTCFADNPNYFIVDYIQVTPN